MKEQVFVDREQELQRLAGCLDKSVAGQGQIRFITGGAGSGKTALVRHFVQQALAVDPDLVVAVGACNAQTGIGDPYLPFREALAMLTGNPSAQQAVGKVAPENANRLRAVLARSVQVLVEVAPELIGVLVPGATLVGALGKAVVKKVGWMDQLDELAKHKPGLGETLAEQSRIFEQYTAFLQRLSAKTPLILFLDDLQWADNASLGLLFHLGRHIDASRVLILGAYRPNDVALGRNGERHPLEPVVHELTRYYGDVTVDLDAIPESVNRQFVDALLDSEPNRLGPSFRQVLFHRTGGHALFTVELIRNMQERGDLVRDGEGYWVEGSSLDWDELPVKVEGVIAERIGRLDDELKEMLTVASVEGEQFTAEVVARVQVMSEAEAIRQLSNELQRRHRLISDLGLVQFGPLQLSLYRFVHNLFQQYLYGSLDEVERACLHRYMGQALEELFAAQTDEVAAQLARHFEEGGVPAKAATYRLQAGNRAQRMSAYQEAIGHLSRGLALLGDLPPGPERLQLELGLQTCLGTTRIATHGYASPEVEKAFARARELCTLLGDPFEVIPVLFGLCMYYMVHGDIQRAHLEEERLLSLAQQAGDIAYVLGGHFLLGATALYQAELERSRWHLEQVVALYDRSRDHDLAYQQGHDPAVVSLLYLSWVLWFQGYPQQATAKMEAGLRLAEEISHPHTSTLAAFFASTFHQLMRQWPQCQAEAERALGLAGRGQFPFWQAGCTMLRGSALTQQGSINEGIAVLQEGLAHWEATGSQLALPYFRAHLAEAFLVAGERGRGLEVLEQSFSNREEVWWLAEQHRVRAELLLLAPGTDTRAETMLREALALARSQGSKSLELRVAMSLASLLQRLGRAAEGRKLLAECYAWFTEGFDTADLQEATALLDLMRVSEQGASTGTLEQRRQSGEDAIVGSSQGSLRSHRLALVPERMSATELHPAHR
jgi:tetratricopeptide (TPR) repeat protein